MAVAPGHSRQRSEKSRQIASQFGVLAVCLLMLAVLWILAAILPPRLLDPGWQLRVTQALINNSFLALLGLALVHLAAHLDPSNPQLIRRRTTFAALAQVVVLGFLLLIPLQGYAVWRGIGHASSRQSSQLREVTGRIAAVREAINRSSSTDDLQQRLRTLEVTPPGPGELTRPLPELRRILLQKLERTELRAADELRGLPPSGLWRIVQGSIRTALSALVLAVGFAAFARGPEASMTLLQSWQTWFQRRLGHSSRGWMGRLRKSRRRRVHREPRSLSQQEETHLGSTPSAGEG